MKQIRFVHVCMECGVSHCGCPDMKEASSPGHHPDGSYKLSEIERAQTDEVEELNLQCPGDGPWPATIGSYIVEVPD